MDTKGNILRYEIGGLVAVVESDDQPQSDASAGKDAQAPAAGAAIEANADAVARLPVSDFFATHEIVLHLFRTSQGIKELAEIFGQKPELITEVAVALFRSLEQDAFDRLTAYRASFCETSPGLSFTFSRNGTRGYALGRQASESSAPENPQR
jgi:hypothetical protein